MFDKLPGIEEEVKEVMEIVQQYMHTDDAMPDIDNVLSQLEDCQVAHFACHGVSDSADPSNSGLVLQRKAAVGTLEQAHLSVHRMAYKW